MRNQASGREWGQEQVAVYLGIDEDIAAQLMEDGLIRANWRHGKWRTIKEACDVYLYKLYLSQDDIILLSKVQSK